MQQRQYRYTIMAGGFVQKSNVEEQMTDSDGDWVGDGMAGVGMGMHGRISAGMG